MLFKLGKQPVVFDGRTPKLSSYLDMPKLPPLPSSSNWLPRVSKFNMGGNDTYGDCVVCGAAHMRQVWTANAGRRELKVSDADIIRTYLQLTDGQDCGLNMLAFLKHWRTNGVFGDKIAAFVSVNPRKVTQMQYANWLFGGVFLGVDMPEAWQRATIWDVGPLGPKGIYEPGSWGGHCVNVVSASSEGYVVSTWGTTIPITAAAMATYADEAFAIITLDWFNVNHKTPDGFAWKDLQADLKVITNA